MQLAIAATPDPRRIHPRLPGYLASMTGHCPYLQPSMNRQLTTWCAYHAAPADAADLLALLVETAEQIRRLRRVHGPLACANIAVYGPSDIPTARAVLDWPHWITRKLYAPVQLMIGKFWIGETENDKLDRPIEPPPVSFFSIRHSITAKDARFLHDLPHVADALASSDDHGQDVLEPVLGVPLSPQTVKQRYSELKALFPGEKVPA